MGIGNNYYFRNHKMTPYQNFRFKALARGERLRSDLVRKQCFSAQEIDLLVAAYLGDDAKEVSDMPLVKNVGGRNCLITFMRTFFPKLVAENSTAIHFMERIKKQND